jgi:hypothetical protein
MVWRDNDLAVDALAVQGYYDEETGTLQQEALAASIRDVFARSVLKSSTGELLDKKTKIIESAGISRDQLMDKIFPGFRERHALTDDEAAVLKREPKDHPDLEERDNAVKEVSTYLWGTMSKTSRAGKVQELLVARKLLLIDVKDLKRDGVLTPMKVATDDHDLIINYYVAPRGDQLVKISGGVRDDCTMVGMTFEGITDRMKRELGASVTTAVGKLMQVAAPDLAMLTSGGPAEPKKALGSASTKS